MFKKIVFLLALCFLICGTIQANFNDLRPELPRSDLGLYLPDVPLPPVPSDLSLLPQIDVSIPSLRLRSTVQLQVAPVGLAVVTAPIAPIFSAEPLSYNDYREFMLNRPLPSLQRMTNSAITAMAISPVELVRPLSLPTPSPIFARPIGLPNRDNFYTSPR